jgi:hypothetical protein
VLAEAIYERIYNSSKWEQVLVSEDWESGDRREDFAHYAADRIREELDRRGVAFVELSNCSCAERTFIHRFVLFRTDSGVVRLDSYGKHEFLVGKKGGVRSVTHSLYCGRLAEWPTWAEDWAS